MHDDAPDSSRPPPSVLDALRQPRRVQLHDPQVLDILRRWKALGRSITMDEFATLVTLLMPREEFRIQHVTKIRAAVLAAGIEIHVPAPQPWRPWWLSPEEADNHDPPSFVKRR